MFVQHVLEIAALKGNASEAAVGPEYQLQESVVADQISLLSREWGYVYPGGLGGCRWATPPDLLLPCSFAEQLVLYLKVAELLSSGLQMAIDQIRAGKLCLSSTVKQGEGGRVGNWGVVGQRVPTWVPRWTAEFQVPRAGRAGGRQAGSYPSPGPAGEDLSPSHGSLSPTPPVSKHPGPCKAGS